ncbi:hypothetical protein [Streptomyces sp. NPDC056661]
MISSPQAWPSMAGLTCSASKILAPGTIAWSSSLGLLGPGR